MVSRKRNRIKLRINRMEIICRPRRAGKTTKLINKAADEFLYIVCHSREEANRVAAHARVIGRDIPHPLTMDELIKHSFNKEGIKGFLFDNGEAFFQRFAGSVPVKAVTFTDD